jgi:hypothetical protein
MPHILFDALPPKKNYQYKEKGKDGHFKKREN